MKSKEKEQQKTYFSNLSLDDCRTYIARIKEKIRPATEPFEDKMHV